MWNISNNDLVIIKNRLNDALLLSGLTVRGLLNKINEKYDLDLNKDTFRSLFSYKNSNINFRCLLYVCKYLKIDLNELCLNYDLRYREQPKPVDFELTDGKYNLFFGKDSSYPDWLFVKTNDEGTREITYIQASIGHKNLLPQYSASNIIGGYHCVDIYFERPFDHKPQFVLHFNNDSLAAAKSLKTFFYTGLITFQSGQCCSKFILLEACNHKSFDNNIDYYLSILKTSPYHIFIRQQKLKTLCKEDIDVKYLVDILKELNLFYCFSDYYYFDSKIFSSYYEINFSKDEYSKFLSQPALERIIKGYLKVCFHSENESEITTNLSDFQMKYLKSQ